MTRQPSTFSKKFFFLIISCIGIFAYFSFAQDLSNYENLSGGEDEQVNTFLQREVKVDGGIKTKAEAFNGKQSGVYDGTTLSCPYAFERDLFVGSEGEDVKLLQVLLNSDKRTLIAVAGPGSLGNESTKFGEATKESVKKFQALFVEYVGVANGRFGPRTRTVMNAICNGQNKPSNAGTEEGRMGRNIFDNVPSIQSQAIPGRIVTIGASGVADRVPPRVSLSANVSTIKLGETFKVILNSSEEIVPVTPDSFIVDGGSVKEIRKLSKTSYTATINVNEDAKDVLIQIEADRIEDLGGNKNENASNEISVKVKGSVIKVAADGSVTGDGIGANINSLLDKIISSAPTCTYNPNGLLKTVDDSGKPLNTTGCAQQQTQNLAGNSNTYDCNGQKIPVTQPCQQQNQTVCTTTQNPFTGAPQQQCQQVNPQQAQAMQQAQQDKQMADMLKSLMGNQGRGFDQDQNRSQPQPQFNPNQFGGQGVDPRLANARDDAKTKEQVNSDIEQLTKGNEALKKELAKCIASKSSTHSDCVKIKNTIATNEQSIKDKKAKLASKSSEGTSGELSHACVDKEELEKNQGDLTDHSAKIADLKRKCSAGASLTKKGDCDQEELEKAQLAQVAFKAQQTSKNKSTNLGELKYNTGVAASDVPVCNYYSINGSQLKKMGDNETDYVFIKSKSIPRGMDLMCSDSEAKDKKFHLPKETTGARKELNFDEVIPGNRLKNTSSLTDDQIDKNKICFVGNYVSSGVKIACYAAAIGGEMPDNAKPIDDILANKSNVYSLLIRKTDVGVYHPTKISSSNTENCENDTAPGIQSSSVNSKTE